MIREAFAGDGVVRDFLEEKREAVEASKPTDVDSTLPGWGEWAGAGLKPGPGGDAGFPLRPPKALQEKTRTCQM